MRVEEGRLTEAYTAVVAPYRSLLQRLGDLSLLLIHDFNHFSMDFRDTFPNTPWGEVLKGNLISIRTNLPKLIEAGFTHMIPTPPEDPTEFRWLGSTREGFDRGIRISPFFGAYALAFMDSMSYMEALVASDGSGEENYLRSLAARKLPLAPIAEGMLSRFYIDGRETDDPTSTVDGIRFIIIYNLLTNAKQHSISTRDNNKLITSKTELDSATGSITVSNQSPYPLPEDFASWETTLALYAHYGAFIASMYAAIGGFSLDNQSEQTGTYIEERTRTREVKPAYTVSVTVK